MGGVESSHTGQRRGWATYVATVAGLGFVPGPAGTYGTAVGVALFAAVPMFADVVSIPSMGLVIIAMGLNLLGVPLCSAAARELDKKDPSAIIWDEIASVFLLLCLLPHSLSWNPLTVGVAFLLHRFFDITKLPPAKQFERLPGGWGIMSDDLVAALYAWLVMLAGNWIWHRASL